MGLIPANGSAKEYWTSSSYSRSSGCSGGCTALTGVDGDGAGPGSSPNLLETLTKGSPGSFRRSRRHYTVGRSLEYLLDNLATLFFYLFLNFKFQVGGELLGQSRKGLELYFTGVTTC